MTGRSRTITLVFCAALGCSQVLGIDEAFVDPKLESSAGGASSGGSEGARGGVASGGSASLGEAGEAASERAGAGGSGHAEDTCEEECGLMREFCVGDALQYRDDQQCLRICRAMPPGASDDDRVNTASCRLRYAVKVRYLAGPELVATCRYAGPGGGGRCGSNCEGLCTLVMSACTPGLSDPYFYQSVDDCLLDCQGLPDAGYVYGTVAAGQSLECRLFHASSAMMGDPDEHCEHALGVSLCVESE